MQTLNNFVGRSLLLSLTSFYSVVLFIALVPGR